MRCLAVGSRGHFLLRWETVTLGDECEARHACGLAQALAAVRAGDTLVVAKLDRLARSVPDARGIADALAARNVRLALGGSVYDPADMFVGNHHIPPA